VVDTPGDYKLHANYKDLYKEAIGVIIAFDATNEKSFNAIKTSWYSNVRSVCSA